MRWTQRSAVLGKVPLAAVAWIVGALAFATSAASVSRDGQPVLISASLLPGLQGAPVSELVALRWNPAADAFEPLVFQIDEVVDHVFQPGTPIEFTERMYDVLREDDGLLDANDEIALRFGDAGATPAPAGAPWPAPAGPLRYEIAIADPREGAPVERRWVYVFRGSSLPRSSDSYVTWYGGAAANIGTDEFRLDFTDRWLLIGYRVVPPCGTGIDLIDRAKGRAAQLEALQEDEENWNANSIFLGGLVGPVRAIRYVRGATSGINTILHDVVYRGWWSRTVNLRVHPIPWVEFYTDWRPTPAGTRIFTPLAREGVDLDGAPDASITDAWVDWNVIRHPDGGVVVLYDVPPSPLYAERHYHYLDDAEYDDRVPLNPDYADEDDSAFGDHGVRIEDIGDSNTQAIRLALDVIPLCSGQGDAATGDAYAAILADPFALVATPQYLSLGAVTGLSARRSGADVVLAWTATAGATGYRVYASAFADLAHASWTVLGETAATTITDPGGAGGAGATYYSVVALGASGEGPW